MLCYIILLRCYCYHYTFFLNILLQSYFLYTSGVISVKSRVDYETVQEIIFKVVAYDTGIPQMSASALITAKVLNINDNDPMFDQVSRDNYPK